MSRLVVRLALLLLVGAISLPMTARAADEYRVRAFIQPDQGISDQQTVRLVIEAEGESSPKLSVGGLDGLVNLRVVSGPDRVINSVWANGRRSAKTQMIYTLLPQAAGAANIPALNVEVDGQRIQTEPIRFDVSAAPQGPPPRPAPGRTSRSSGDADRVDAFVQGRLGEDEVWVGQAVSLSLLLYRGNERLSSPAFVEQPSLSSFWVEEIEVDAEAEASRTTIEGRSYIVYPMARKILVPQTAGEIAIEPFVLQMQAQTRSGDPFESLFSFGRMRTIVRRSEALQLKVRPLPDDGVPPGFGGAVGSYTFQVKLDRDEAAVNEAVALTATVEGEGFLRAVAPPALDLPPDIKKFDPKLTSSQRTVRGRLVSRKTWEWILVPLVPGELKIPPISFPYFDTTKDRYEVAEGVLPRLVVRQTDEAPDSAVARGDIQLQRRDLAFIKPLRGRLAQRSSRAHGRPQFLLLLLAPLVWGPLVVVIGRHRAKLQQNQGLARSRRARARARQRLRSAAKRMESLESSRFHEEVARALVEYVADRFNRSAAGLTYQLADELLGSRGLDADLLRRFRSCLESCDFAQFVPASSSAERRSEVLAEANDLVDRLEKAL